jgi:hypothetical protein
MMFRIGEKEYSGSSALEIIDALRQDMMEPQNQRLSLRQFLIWSLGQLSDRIPLRELDVSDKLSNEMVALSYLYLRDEYGAGELLDVPNRIDWAHTL